MCIPSTFLAAEKFRELLYLSSRGLRTTSHPKDPWLDGFKAGFFQGWFSEFLHQVKQVELASEWDPI